MAGNVHELRPKTGDTEKITINLGYVDLGHIDLMVHEGFEPNRLHPHRHPQPARATCRRGEAVGSPQESGLGPAPL
jgi:hypothetical protein